MDKLQHLQQELEAKKWQRQILRERREKEERQKPIDNIETFGEIEWDNNLFNELKLGEEIPEYQ